MLVRKKKLRSDEMALPVDETKRVLIFILYVTTDNHKTVHEESADYV